MNDNNITYTLLAACGDDESNLWTLQLVTEERWGGLSGFVAAYTEAEAEFSCLCEEAADRGDDGIDLGYAWGILTAAANLTGEGMEAALRAACEMLVEGRA